jgi:hypothetical protein
VFLQKERDCEVWLRARIRSLVLWSVVVGYVVGLAFQKFVFVYGLCMRAKCYLSVCGGGGGLRRASRGVWGWLCVEEGREGRRCIVSRAWDRVEVYASLKLVLVFPFTTVRMALSFIERGVMRMHSAVLENLIFRCV